MQTLLLMVFGKVCLVTHCSLALRLQACSIGHKASAQVCWLYFRHINAILVSKTGSETSLRLVLTPSLKRCIALTPACSRRGVAASSLLHAVSWVHASLLLLL